MRSWKGNLITLITRWQVAVDYPDVSPSSHGIEYYKRLKVPIYIYYSILCRNNQGGDKMNDIEARLEKELETIAKVKKDAVDAINDRILFSRITLDTYVALTDEYLEEPTKATKAVVNRIFKPLIRIEELNIKRLERQLEALECE